MSCPGKGPSKVDPLVLPKKLKSNGVLLVVVEMHIQVRMRAMWDHTK